MFFWLRPCDCALACVVCGALEPEEGKTTTVCVDVTTLGAADKMGVGDGLKSVTRVVKEGKLTGSVTGSEEAGSKRPVVDSSKESPAPVGSSLWEDGSGSVNVTTMVEVTSRAELLDEAPMLAAARDSKGEWGTRRL